MSISLSLPSARRSKIDAHPDRVRLCARISVAIAVMALVPLACASSEPDPIHVMARAILDARERGDADPLLCNGSIGCDERTAYQVQRLLVESLSRRSSIAGFKAALTSPAAQQRFGVDGPAFGVLFEQGRLEPGAVVSTTAFRSPLVETEIGYWLSAAVSEPVRDAQAMRTLIRRVALVVELPDMRFASRSSVRAPDLIATNAGSAYWVVGPELASGCVPNALEVSLELSLDESEPGSSPRTEISRGRGDEPFGEQLEALRWLVNAAVRAGYTVLPDQLLITGAIGGVTRGAPGRYLARYSGCGEVGFTLGSDSE